MRKGDTFKHTSVVNQEFGRKIISTVYYKIISCDNRIDIIGAEKIFVCLDRDIRINGVHLLSSRFNLGNVNIFGKMCYLPLQV